MHYKKQILRVTKNTTDNNKQLKKGTGIPFKKDEGILSVKSGAEAEDMLKDSYRNLIKYLVQMLNRLKKVKQNLKSIHFL